MAPGETACTHQHAQWPRTSHTREVLQKPNARPLGWLQGRQPHTDRNRQGGREVHLQLRAALYGLLENVMAGGDPAGSGGPDGAAGRHPRVWRDAPSTAPALLKVVNSFFVVVVVFVLKYPKAVSSQFKLYV